MTSGKGMEDTSISYTFFTVDTRGAVVGREVRQARLMTIWFCPAADRYCYQPGLSHLPANHRAARIYGKKGITDRCIFHPLAAGHHY